MMIHVGGKLKVGGRSKYTRADFEEAQRLRRLGKTMAEVAFEMGCTKKQVWRFTTGAAPYPGEHKQGRKARGRISAEVDRMRAMVAEGAGYLDIQAALNLPGEVVRQRLKVAGLVLRHPSRCDARIKEDQVEVVRGMAAAGWSQRQVAEHYGSCQASVAKFMAKHKIEPMARKIPPIRTWVEENRFLDAQ